MAAQFTPNQIKLENSDSGENITEIQNYLDTFNKEIEGGDGTATIAAVTSKLSYLYYFIFTYLSSFRTISGNEILYITSLNV